MLTTIVTLLASKNPPTAFFCSNNLITRNTLHALSTLNVKVPDDIALVGFDDFEMADIVRPAITVVRQPPDLLGSTAAELLFSRLDAEKLPETGRRIVLPVELIVRDSCGKHDKTLNRSATAREGKAE
jgi:LacI family transcriptional regulator